MIFNQNCNNVNIKYYEEFLNINKKYDPNEISVCDFSCYVYGS